MMCKIRFVQVVAGLAILQAPLKADLTAAEPRRIPGTGVSLEPPKGFSPSKRFPGFVSEDLGAIMVTEMPGPVAEYKKGLAPEMLRAQGAELISSKRESFDGRECLLVKMRQTTEEDVVLKWILVTGGEKETLLIVAEFPKDLDPEVDEAIRASILKASWKPETKSKDPFEGLPFRITATSKLKVAGRMGNNLLLTPSGTFGPHGPEEPSYIVGCSHVDVEIEDLRLFCESRLKEVTTIRGVRDIQSRLVQVGGMKACELVADATHRDTRTPVRVYQLIALTRSNPKAYYVARGRTTKEKAAEFFREFRRVSESLCELDQDNPSEPARKEQKHEPERLPARS